MGVLDFLRGTPKDSRFAHQPSIILFYSQERLTDLMFNQTEIRYIPGDILPTMSEALIRYSEAFHNENGESAYSALRDFSIMSYYFRKRGSGSLIDVRPFLTDSTKEKIKFVKGLKEVCQLNREKNRLGPVEKFYREWQENIAPWESGKKVSIDQDVLFLNSVISFAYRALKNYTPVYFGEMQKKQVEGFTTILENISEDISFRDYNHLYGHVVELDAFVQGYLSA